MQKKVIFTGFISEKELDSLLRTAEMLVYPSLYEGFGIPVLEGMKLGIPVITSSTTAMPEVAGDAALLVDPLDVNALSEAMDRILQDRDYAAHLRELGPTRAEPFTWHRNGEQHLALYRELIGA